MAARPTRNASPADDFKSELAALGKKAQGSTRALTNGAILCSIPGCGGIVKADYIVALPSGKKVGRCVNRALHEALSARDADTKAMSQGLTQLYQQKRLRELK